MGCQCGLGLFLTFRQRKQSTVFEVNNLTGQTLTRCSAAKLEGLGMLAGDALVVENVMKSKIFVFVLQVAALFLFLSRSLSPCNLALKRKFPDDEDTVTLPEVTGKKFCYCLFFLRRVHVISLSIWVGTDKKHRTLAPRPEVVKDLKPNWKGKNKVPEVEEGEDDDDEEARRERAKHFPRMI